MTHNFTIGGLGFHKLVNDEHPYERATAPFRKEQVDTAAQVGDQSLTGWWTRGQLSLHGGAGINYYEVLAGESVLNRFHDSEAINTSTPGVATLAREPVTVPGVTPTGTFLDSAAAPATKPGHMAWVDSGGVKRLVDGVVDVISTDSASRGLAADPNYYYVVDGDSNAIVRFPIEGATTVETVYTFTTDQGITGLWILKDRLWCTGGAGEVYATPAEPATLGGALPATDVVFDIPNPSLFSQWTLAASPQSVYVGARNVIYKIVLEADGSVPTLAWGTTATELPRGEQIIAMHYLLGFMVLGTTAGVRAASVSDDGSLIFGPLITDDPIAGERMASLGSSVYALLRDNDDEAVGRVVKIDMQWPSPENPLVFAYSTVATTTLAAGASPTVGMVAAVGGVVEFSENSTLAAIRLHEATGLDLASSGFVETGQHRFGTLEPKHFSGVSIRCGGAGGTVTVHAVTPEGVETELTSIDTALSTGTDVSLVVNPPVESVALKFVLTRDPTDPTVGPELLGYQLKALPAPVRQRLIRVPLMLFDIERGPTGRSIGKEKEAWTRLAALEALEESDSLVEFEDTETGETGTAYIETIEVLRRNGSRGNSRSNGFGGVVTITLRKVA